jgi:RHS repeat-associated protein
MNYDAGNQMTSLNRYSDVLGANLVASSLYTYDSASRLTSINYQRANNTTINSFSYTYDAANRLTQETSTDGTSNYSYDATNQLTGTDNTNQADEAYSYDANGNRTTVGYGTGTNNQLLTDGKFNYQYDDEGNRTRKVEIATGEVTAYGWDYRNRLISVTVADVNGVVIKSVAYTYDVNNRRIGKVVDVDGVGAATATVERFVYDGNQIGLVFDAQGNQTHRYLYGASVDQIFADETVTGTNWAVTDKLGTVTDVIDNNGLVLNHIVYDSFGKVVSRSDTSFDFRYGFTGREYDGETGLDYYRARYYDSGNGRFIGEDPLGFGAGDGNLTRYVGNSPTNWVDPSGKAPVLERPVLTPPLVTPPLVTPPPFNPIPGLIRSLPALGVFWQGVQGGDLSDGTIPLNRPVPRRPPAPSSPSSSPDVITPPNPNVCKDDENKKTCDDEFPSHDTPPLYPQELRFSSFTQKDLTIFPQISVMKANRTRIYNDPRELEVVKVESMTKKRYKDPNNVAMHYNIGIWGFLYKPSKRGNKHIYTRELADCSDRF